MVDPKKSLQEWLNEQGRPTPEESAQFETERKAAEGTMWEWAQMQPNGDIAVRVTDRSVGGGHGVGGFVVRPDDEDYEKAKQQYGLEKPGDTYHKQEKWINGEWVTVLEEKPEQKPNTGTAKTA
jgi:hypothetical protein